MDLNESENLMREYIKQFDRIIFLRLKYSGFRRFDIKNNRIVQRSYKTLLKNLFILIVANIGASILLSTSATQDLKMPEVLTIIHFVTYANLFLINSSMFNKNSGYEIISRCIDIDVFLGAEETSFMRKATIINLVGSCVLVTVISLGVVTYMYIIFKVSMLVHVIGSTYFAWLFCVYDDYCFYLAIFGFMSMRVKYLNMALMKLSAMNTEYVPDLFIFRILYWKDRFDNKITFHMRAGQKEFTQAFRMLFNLFDVTIQGYRFGLILGVWTVAMGTFVSVQAFIIYIKSSRVDILRASVVSGWAAGTWLFTLFLSQLMDMFCQQIQQTIQICSYIQLNPTISPEIHQLTKAILRTLEVRDPRAQSYGMFFFDTGLVFRIAASTFVYITVQLQMAFPSSEEALYTNNVTISTSACTFMPPYSCSVIG